MPIKRSIQLLVLILSFCFFTQNSKAAFFITPITHHAKELKAYKKDSSKQKAGKFVFKRKRKVRKPKGIEVDVPQITRAPLNTIITYIELSIVYSEDFISSLHNYSNLKRGPPLA